jgi:hypothetical protein
LTRELSSAVNVSLDPYQQPFQVLRRTISVSRFPSGVDPNAPP